MADFSEALSIPPGDRPAMYFSDTSRTGRPFAKDPSVIRFQGRYLLYYTLPPSTPDRAPADFPNGYGIGIAESDDLTQWRRIGEMASLPGTVEANGICAPGACVLNGQVHLFYQTYGNGPKDAVCHAFSGDGIDFQRDPTNPVFRPDGAWNVGRAIDAEVFVHEDNLYLYYATRDPAMQMQMVGVAVAHLASDLGRGAWKHLSVDGPALRPELPWEQDCIEAPTVCRHGDRLYMFYGGAYNNAPQQIGCATSTDGVRWTRLRDDPLLANGQPGTWNACESGHPGVFQDEDGQTSLFFQGNNDFGATWFLSRKRVVWTPDGTPALVD